MIDERFHFLFVRLCAYYSTKQSFFLIVLLSQLVACMCRCKKLFFSSHFPSAKYFYECGKQCSEQPDVFFSFSCIFGCELTVFSVNLDAEHWNLEFFGWTKNVVWVNPKNSRFQCEASRWTEKNVREQTKMQEKLKKTQVVAHCIVFRIHRNNFEDGKWLEWNFSGWTWAQFRCSQYHFLNERKLTYT